MSSWRWIAVLLLLPATSAAASPDDVFYWKVAPPSVGVPTRRRPAESPELSNRGARLYQRHCAICHGLTGAGDGAIASRLLVPPRDFRSALFKVRSTPSGSLPTDLDLFATISRGMHGTDMAPWTRLPQQQRWALVTHLKSLSPRFGVEEPEASVSVPPPGGSRAALRARGETLYALLRCGNCHGVTGRGDGPGISLYADEPQAVRIRDLSRAYFVRGDTPRDIFLSLRTGLDGTPMGAFDLPADDLWALAFYVRDVIRQPPPPEPLPRAEQTNAR